MGTTTLLCCRKTKAATATTTIEEEEKNKNTRNVGSFAKIVKQSCIWTTKKKTNIRQLNNLHLHEEKNNSNNNNTEEQQLVTLEEWILGSPSLKNLQSFITNSTSEEYSQSHLVVVSKQTYYNNSNNNSRVYPTFDRNLQERSSCSSFIGKSSEKLNISMMEKSAKLLGEEKADFSQSCSSKMKIKINKKVTFRLPRVADIFMLDSPEGHFENV